jgi:hypothetical protein
MFDTSGVLQTPPLSEAPSFAESKNWTVRQTWFRAWANSHGRSSNREVLINSDCLSELAVRLSPDLCQPVG